MAHFCRKEKTQAMAPKFRLIVFCWLCLTATSNAATRVALVSTCGGDSGRNVLALAEARLSARPEIVLVERKEVERILSEQKLVRCGMSDAEQAVAVGRLLGVEVFATLETFPGSHEALGLIAFDASSGVKLWDAPLAEGDLVAAAESVATAVDGAIDKRRRMPAGVVTLCVLSVRNADLPRELDSFCESVGLLLERQLLSSPGIAVLERRRLEQVNKERVLPLAKSPGELFPSLIVVDMEVSRSTEAKTILATALLSDSASKTKATVVGRAAERDALALAQALAKNIAAKLSVAGTGIVGDRGREAERFEQEAKFLNDQGDLPAALRSIEAAAALDPESDAIRVRLAELLARHAGELLKDGVRDANHALDVGLRALELATEVRFHAPVNRKEFFGPERYLVGHGFWDRLAPWFGQLDAEAQRKLLKFQEQVRDFQVHIAAQEGRARIKDWWDFGFYTEWLYSVLYGLDQYEPTSEAWTTDTIHLVSEWLKDAERFVPWFGWTMHYPRIPARLYYTAKAPGSIHQHTHLIKQWSLTESDLARLNQLFQKQEKHPCPLIQCYGAIGQFATELRGVDRMTPSLQTRYRQAMDFIRAKLGAPRIDKFDTNRCHEYDAALDLIDLLPEAEMRKREYADLFQFMLDRKEIAYWVVRMVTDPDIHTFRHYNSTAGYGWLVDIFPYEKVTVPPEEYPKLLENIERVLALYRSPDFHDVDTVPWSHLHGTFDREMEALRQKIFEERPELEKLASAPWTAKRLLFSANGPALQRVLVADNSVYAAVAGGSVRVVRIPLNGEKSVVVGEAKIGSGTITSLAVAESAFCLGTQKAGILVLSRGQDPMRTFDHSTGLPSDDVESLACAGDKLYAGVSGGYLVTCDLKSGHCEVIASSRRKDKKSPLDDTSPVFEISAMLSDPDRHRVLFLADLKSGADCRPLQGLWSLDTRTETLTQLLRIDIRPHWMQRNWGNQVLIQFALQGAVDVFSACGATPTGVISFDLASDKAELPYAWDNRQAGPTLPPAPKFIQVALQLRPPNVLLDGWLWFWDQPRQRVCRIPPDGKGIEYLPPLDATGRSSRRDWKTWQLINDGRQMLMADSQDIWLLTMPTKETP